MKRVLRENGLSLAFGMLFLGALCAQAIAGHADFNHQQIAHHGDPITMGRYLAGSDFWADVMENWQSEYLQFTLYIFGTIWLLQRGSSESKELDKAGLESDEDQMVGADARPDSPRWAAVGGIRTAIYGNSLLIVMGTIWLGTWAAQSIAGRVAHNEELIDHQETPLSWVAYIASSDFWNRTLQNWQSELLAVGSTVILSVYLRQRGSPESKPVGSPHTATGEEG